MKVLLIILTMAVTFGCSREADDNYNIKIGERVSNGVCTGYVVAYTYRDFVVAPWVCGNITINFANVPKKEVYSIDKNKQKGD